MKCILLLGCTAICKNLFAEAAPKSDVTVEFTCIFGWSVGFLEFRPIHRLSYVKYWYVQLLNPKKWKSKRTTSWVAQSLTLAALSS
jgi:hypothetical protein